MDADLVRRAPEAAGILLGHEQRNVEHRSAAHEELTRGDHPSPGREGASVPLLEVDEHENGPRAFEQSGMSHAGLP
jgi:hypothetical protein